MGKTGKWLKSFLTGKKDKAKEREKLANNQNSPSVPIENPTTPISITPATPKEKKRWSFRRSSATVPAAAASSKEYTNSTELITATTPPPAVVQAALGNEADEQKKHVMVVAAATAAAADAAMAAAQAAAVVIRLTAAATERASAVEEASAIKIQSVFRSYLDIDRGMEETIKIVEMDIGESKGSMKSRNSYSNHSQTEGNEQRFSTHYASHQAYSKQDNFQVSPVPSAITDKSPKACNEHFEDYSFSTAQSSPQYYSAVSIPNTSKVPFAFPQPDYAETMSYDYPLFPNYMANTESSKAKARSQSAPKQRPPDSFERQPSRRRASMEGRNVPRAMRMQRSSSHVGATAQNYQYPGLIKLDRSTVSLIQSECGSTSTVLTNTNYCKSLVAYDVRMNET